MPNIWKHSIPAARSRDRRVAVTHDGALLLVSVELRRSPDGDPIVDVLFDDPARDFTFTPEDARPPGRGR